MENLLESRARLLALLNHIYLLGMVTVIAGVLTAAMTLQYAYGEIPCPLCLLQRAAMFGVCFGILQNLRGTYADRNTGFSLLFALLLLVVSERQTLLDIYPRPGHEYVGTAVLGLHMPVWSVVIALCLLIAFALRLAVLGGNAHMRGNEASTFPLVYKAAGIASLYVIAICAINLVSAVLQCGLGQCHTTGYALLQ
ncbi:disulfide bond formation protein B [Aestuariivirga sp.]|uniref:disulfide bond formation protein B n=1 Tax=Aestuariivirga sp. TaxID=2650926 RepID=UPI0035936914